MAKTRMSRPERLDPSPAPARERKVDLSLLDEEKRKEITRLAEEMLLERDRQAAEDAFLDAEKARLDAERHPETVEEEREILVDVPEFCDGIRLDGKFYPHGWRGQVSKGLYDSMQEIMFRARMHDDEVNGKNERARSWRRSLTERNPTLQVGGAGSQPRF